MRILHVINHLQIGGAQKLLADLLPILKSENDFSIDVAVFKTYATENERILSEAGIRIINLDSPLKSPKGLMRLIPLLKNYDLIHVHLFPASYISAIAGLACNRPLVYTEHSTHNRRRDHKWLRPIEKFIYSRFSKVACISDDTRRNLTKWLGDKVAAERLLTINNGINLDKFKDAIPLPAEKVFGKNGFPIIMVSRFVESKDQPTLIKAISLIDRDDVFAVFAGDGPRLSECKSLAKELGVGDRVFFLGNRDDIPSLVKSSFIGVQSSNWEGFGLTAIEMMAGGIPVIVSDVDGLRQTVGDAALKFQPGDAQKLAEDITKLIDDTSIRESLILHGLKKCNDYSIAKTTHEYAGLYYQCCNNQQIRE